MRLCKAGYIRRPFGELAAEPSEGVHWELDNFESNNENPLTVTTQY